MYLPPELLTLLFLANAAAAVPQTSFLPNVTEIAPTQQSTVSIAAQITEPSDATATESSVDRVDVKVEVCTLDASSCCSIDPGSCGGLQWIVLPSATGWGLTGPATDRLVTLTPTATTVTTTRPTILNLETSVLVWGTEQESEGSAGQPGLIIGPSTVRASNTIGEGPGATGSAQQQIEQHSLLLQIVSQIGRAPSNVQPAQPASPATENPGQTVAPINNHNGGDSALAQPATTPDSGMASNTDMISPPQTAPAVAIGEFVYGTQTLTLTAGLSTNIGSNFFPTFVGLTTDADGNTLVSVFSDGTAVIATVRVAPTTMVVPRSGFEASTTDAASPGEQTGGLATTPSKEAGAGRRRKLEWWMGAVLGALSFGAMF